MNKAIHNTIYEFSIYSADFSNQLILKLSNPEFNTISITNKKYNTPTIDIIKKIQNINPKIDIIPYYSLKYHQKNSLQETISSFIHHIEEYQSLNIKEVLLISGVPKPKYKTTQVLNHLKSIYKPNLYPKIAIAYNPFIPELEAENISIKTKLKSGIISSIYLQIGIDLQTIQKSVHYLRKLQPNLNIYLSLMNPSPSRLAQFRYRPWKGVSLSEEYLQSPKNALNINKSIYKLAQKMKIGVIQGD